MLPATLLAAALWPVDRPAPNPPAAAWSARSKAAVAGSLEGFATRAVDAVSGGEWAAFVRVASKKVVFETYEKSSESAGSVVLFDDANAPPDAPVVAYTCRKLVVDTSRRAPSFALDQFAYFASLVRESVSHASSIPKWSPNLASPTGDMRAPTVSGPIATNATWRVVFGRSGAEYRVQRLVIEYH